jgi:hypothetical protein
MGIVNDQGVEVCPREVARPGVKDVLQAGDEDGVARDGLGGDLAGPSRNRDTRCVLRPIVTARFSPS